MILLVINAIDIIISYLKKTFFSKLISHCFFKIKINIQKNGLRSTSGNSWFLGMIDRSSHPEMFLGKGVLKICSQFTGETSCRSAISIKLLCKFIEVALLHGFSPVNLLRIVRISFPKNTSGWLLLH